MAYVFKRISQRLMVLWGRAKTKSFFKSHADLQLPSHWQAKICDSLQNILTAAE